MIFADAGDNALISGGIAFGCLGSGFEQSEDVCYDGSLRVDLSTCLLGGRAFGFDPRASS